MADMTTLIVTRELRWFHRGPIPAAVFDWFGRLEGDADYEERIDRYDLLAASRNAGVKYRNETYLDSKFLIAIPTDVDVPPSFPGRVEDWVKLSTPIDASQPPHDADFVEVAKEIHTHRYPTPSSIGSDVERGCEIEVVGIRLGDVEAWSLCFESYGLPEHRAEDFAVGFGYAVDVAAPEDVALTSDESFGYPTWLAAMTAVG